MRRAAVAFLLTGVALLGTASAALAQEVVTGEECTEAGGRVVLGPGVEYYCIGGDHHGKQVEG
ncbi:hypothetical protein SAMN05421805_106160 [Saccharopolyspora antimicrobica]|uniref:Uncharacterized protein n=1 Tax=Saccharopolyspora antimicrobica TaxID=455193 RepID=A0A1I5B976_9PSEU|nr:hypothetical protein [Saccharopolyspora antimicrobica]RKT86507.1 hypothetical protein ATL45_4885 [Saccharopolyspora antimicrobica]SFN71101.1 hypothetical protein SAMN05421805_106160 [Saccharopolyspora antimicrobica]